VQPDKGCAADGIDDIFIESHERSSPFYVRFLSGGTMECRIDVQGIRVRTDLCLKMPAAELSYQQRHGKKILSKEGKTCFGT
jgi:hypothetical protein